MKVTRADVLEIDAFEKDGAPNALARVVDRLLASEHQGERWARHWFELACYTDDLGGTDATVITLYVFRDRDWAVKAFNDDMPSDRFVHLQFASLRPVPDHPAADR